MNIAILTVSALSLAASLTTLVVVVVGGAKAKVEIEQVRTKANNGLSQLKAALDNLEI